MAGLKFRFYIKLSTTSNVRHCKMAAVGHLCLFCVDRVGRSVFVRGWKGVWGMFLSIVSGGSGSQVMRVEGGSGG